MTTPAEEFQARIANLQQALPAQTALLIAKPSHVTYFTGVPTLVPSEREALLFVSSQKVVLFANSFLPPASLQNLQLLYGISATNIAKNVLTVLQQSQPAIVKIQLDEKALFANEYQEITRSLPTQAAAVTFEALDETPLWALRQRKSQAEIASIRQASEIALLVFQKVTSELEVGITEKAVQQRLDALMIEHGAQPSFPTIVAFGPHSAAPHHQPMPTQLTNNTAILIDWGCQIDSYCSDFTRSWWFGSSPNSEWQSLEKAVMAAYQAGLSAAQVGLPIADVDQAARASLKAAGLGEYFIHTTGHGIGIDVHELPSVYQTSVGNLAEGMVVTIEPGAYLNGKFGYRHENTVLVGADGPIPLG